nr:glutamate--tRNA ligase [Planctomycetota bacterium]MBU1517993.1 glutamate--tRNA ligase [Planctomycetota bacterium]MBU2458532.1 glutamate--tRNA ligase [Planctomycetota bacterium]
MAVTRFAPSPTGYLHIGGARTALFDLLWARKTGGRFILRIEDTDQSRNSLTAAKQVMDDLKWLGIQWDEGPEIEGPAGPYYQSQRLDIYNRYIEQLLNAGKAYYCFDTTDKLNQMRKKAAENKQNFVYPRPVKLPDSADVEKAKAQDKDVMVRFCMPDEEVVVNDEVRGQVKFNGRDISDFIILKSDGFPTYHFACVIDDELMGITHVVRGQEHLMNTPGHIAMQKALGFKTPVYAHMSITVSEGGGKMSKRDRAKVLKNAIKKTEGLDKEKLASIGGISTTQLDGFLTGDSTPDNPAVDAMAEFLNVELPEVNIVDFFKSGYLPQALVNFIALLGYSAPGDKEILTLQELIDTFDPSRFNKTNSLFDRKKLLAFNTEHMKMLGEEELLSRYKDFLEVVKSPAAGADDALLKRVIKASQGARTLADIDHKSRFLFIETGKIEYNKKDVEKVLLKNSAEGLAMLAELKEQLLKLPALNEETIEKMLRGLAEQKQVGLGKVAQPLRVAICGTTVSLPIFESIDMLGLEETVKRIDNTLNKFGWNLL